MNEQGTSLTQRKEKRSKRKDEEGENKNGSGDDDGFGNGAQDEENVEWFTDVSEKAVEERMKDLSMGVKSLAMDNDMEKSEKEKMDIFHQFVNQKKAMSMSCEKMSQSIEKEILTEAERLEIVNKATIVLCEVMLDGEKVVAQIKEHKRLFLRFTNTNQKAQKYLLGGIECLIAARENLLLPKATAIFKAFYDHDIIEEEVILDWGKKVSKKYVSKALSEKIHEKVKPFLTWLKEAEEDSSDEESDDGVQLEFDERVHASGIKEKKEKPINNGKVEEKKEEVTTNGNEEEDDDDLDIDDI